MTRPRWLRRIWWIDQYCDLFGHQWKQREENWAAFECQRCHRKRLMIYRPDTCKMEWMITP